MAFIACGLNHQTAPISVREKVALTSSAQSELLLSLVAQPSIYEAAVLSTCNRTEIYCHTDEPEAVIPWLAQEHQLSASQLAQHAYCYQDNEAIRHVLRVACGLNSMMLGEPQILGQVKQAYLQACNAGTVGSQLHSVFRYILSASKRVRSNTAIGVNPISVAFAAVNLIKQTFTDLSAVPILLIGAGETTQLVAKYLQDFGANQFVIANRSYKPTQLFADTLKAKIIDIKNIPDYLPNADIVVSATACPWPFIGKGMVERALKIRQQKPLWLLDLAVPRDIEPEVGELAAIKLYNIDDLNSIVEQGFSARREAAKQAEQMIEYEVENFIRWQRGLVAKEVICQYRRKMTELGEQETQRAIQALQQGQPAELVIQQLSHRLINKLTHQPTARLRQAGSLGNDEILTTIKQLLADEVVS